MYLVATHPVFSGPAVERLSGAGFKEVVVTNSIPVIGKEFDSLTVLSVAPLLADVIASVHDAKSLTDIMRSPNK